MKLPQMLRVNIVALSILSVFCSVPVQSQEQKSPDKSVITPEEMGITVVHKEGVDAREYGLTMTVKPDKAVYAVGEPININITVQNNSGWYFRGFGKCNHRVEDQKPDYQVFDENGHELPFEKITQKYIDWAMEIERREKLGKGNPGLRISCTDGTYIDPGTSIRVREVTSYYAITAPGTYLLKYEERGSLGNEKPRTVFFGNTKLSASTSIVVK
jgi:hypothetical protein